MPETTPSGRKITPGVKLGRPAGAVSTVETKLSHVLKIVLGGESEAIIQALREKGAGFALDQHIGISVKWAKQRGFVFEQKEVVEIPAASPERPVKPLADFCEVEKFD